MRQPSPCVRAFCESGVLFHMSHLKLHFALHTSHCTLHNLHTPHFTLHASHCTVHTSHFTVHTSHFTVHTSHFTVHTSYFTLHTSHCTLLAPHFTLHTSSHLSSSHLIPAHLFSSLLICHLSFHESLPSTTTKELACAVRQPGPCVRALCEAVAMLLSKNMTCARPRCNATSSKHFPHTSHCTLHTSHLSSFHCSHSNTIYEI